MTGFVTSVVVALIGAIIFAAFSRYSANYRLVPYQLEKTINEFVSSARQCLQWSSTTEQEADSLRYRIGEMEARRDMIGSQFKDASVDSVANFFTGVLFMFPFNTFALVNYYFGIGVGIAFLYTVLTYIFAAIFIAIYIHFLGGNKLAPEVEKVTTNFDNLISELSDTIYKTDFESLQDNYRKINTAISSADKLSKMNDQGNANHYIAGIVSLVSLAVTWLLPLLRP